MINNRIFCRLLVSSLLPWLSLSFTPTTPPAINGAWRMTAHRISPPKDGITDLYAHFKDLYGGCRNDIGMTLNDDGTLKMTPGGGCQNPLGNFIIKAAAKFMPSGNVSWEVAGDKVVLQDKKGQRKEYGLQVNGTDMQWSFDETEKQTTVHHTIEFKRE